MGKGPCRGAVLVSSRFNGLLGVTWCPFLSSEAVVKPVPI